LWQSIELQRKTPIANSFSHQHGSSEDKSCHWETISRLAENGSDRYHRKLFALPCSATQQSLHGDSSASWASTRLVWQPVKSEEVAIERVPANPVYFTTNSMDALGCLSCHHFVAQPGTLEFAANPTVSRPGKRANPDCWRNSYGKDD